MKLQMVRQGTFVVQKPGVDGQCGAKGTQTFEYKVVLDSSSKHLNSKGFIIDNLLIHQYFVNKYNYKSQAKFVSCEMMATIAVRDLRKMFEKANIKVYGIQCSISGMKGATMWARWKAPKQKVPIQQIVVNAEILDQVVEATHKNMQKELMLVHNTPEDFMP
jgi:hypothetical protein